MSEDLLTDQRPVLTRHHDGVGEIVLNRPGAMNAVTVELGRALQEALTELGARPEVNVIVISGSGGNFSVGGDFHEVQRLRSQGPAALAPLFEHFGRACESIAELEVPVVAAVEGYAMAGGFELMLAADVVLIADDAKIADNHSNFGQIPGGGSSQRLPRIVGRQRALGLMLSGERLSGLQAVEWGLAYRSFPPAAFQQGVAAFVTKLAGKSRPSLAGIKRLVHAGSTVPLPQALLMERHAVAEFIASDVAAAGITQFNARRP